MGLRRMLNDWRRMRIYKRKLKVLHIEILDEGYKASIGCPSSIYELDRLEEERDRVLKGMRRTAVGSHVRR